MTAATHLSDDHIDLLVTAAREWRVLIPRTMAAFNDSLLAPHLIVGAANEVGKLLRHENTESMRWLTLQGRVKPADQHEPDHYTFQPVDHLDPVEVVKAAHAAMEACSSSPTWSASPAKRLLDAVLKAATLRLEGYADAPWWWTRPQTRSGPMVGVVTDPTDPHPDLPGVVWVSAHNVVDHWDDAPLVLVTVPAAGALPADLKPRSGVFVLEMGDDHEAVWEALVALDMQVLVAHWPTCETWLLDQLHSPNPEFVQYRSER